MENDQTRQQLDRTMEVTLGEKTWHLIPTGSLPDGEYGCTYHDENRILLGAVAADDEFLDLVIHESLHAAFPWMREWSVDQTATEIATILWKMGYRKP